MTVTAGATIGLGAAVAFWTFAHEWTALSPARGIALVASLRSPGGGWLDGRARRVERMRTRRRMIAAIGVALTVSLSAQDQPPRHLLIHRDVLKPGTEATYKTIEQDAARFCAELKCPNAHLALESLTPPTEVLWLTAYDSEAEKQKIIDDYAANQPLTTALAGITKRREGLLTTDVDIFTVYKEDLSRGNPWSPAGTRFVVVTMTTRGDRLEGSVFEAPDGTRFGLSGFKTREAAEAAVAAVGREARVFAVRPYWGLPAKEWIAADPEFWAPAAAAR
jgi:hypothetical protein